MHVGPSNSTQVDESCTPHGSRLIRGGLPCLRNHLVRLLGPSGAGLVGVHVHLLVIDAV